MWEKKKGRKTELSMSNAEKKPVAFSITAILPRQGSSYYTERSGYILSTTLIIVTRMLWERRSGTR